jgi:hypothetical protein
MKIAIMQPYFLPYLGYFQLIAAVDRFVVYDTIQFTKKGWINRNQMLRDGAAVMFTLPVKKGSDYLNVVDRQLADDFDPKTLLSQIAGAYRKAPQFASTMPLIEAILQYRSVNLFDFLLHSLRQCCTHLNIATPLTMSSVVEQGPQHLQGQNRVIDLCKRLDGDVYINPPGGRALYAAVDFKAQGLGLQFIQPRLRSYPQMGADFVPSLSILDVMMFNTPDQINSTLLRDFDLVD